jgi:hypothetical protein
MNSRYYSAIFLTLCLQTIVSSCNDDEVEPGETGSITIEFDNRIGEEEFAFNTDYTNAAGETFSVSKLKYYISNIKLITINGKTYEVPQDSSYFLVDEQDEETQEITIHHVPAGDYNKIIFTIGVDEERSAMDLSKRKGVLDPQLNPDMYWSDDTGYIFLNMEGTSPSAPAQSEHAFVYHIGGFKQALNNIKTATIDLGTARALVRSEKIPEVHIYADVLEFFKNPANISIAENPNVELTEFSKTVAANYTDMFRFNHVHN